MGSSNFSLRRQRKTRPVTDVDIRQWIARNKYRKVRKVLHGSSKEFRRSLFRASQELRPLVHLAVDQENMSLLKFLVKYCQAHLEARNERGLTPLYSAVDRLWESGARFLLKHGADVQNAEASLSAASCLYKPLVHAVMRRESRALLKEILKRGADINVLDLEGNHCLNSPYVYMSSTFRKFVHRQVMKTEQEKEERQGSPETILYEIYHSGLRFQYFKNDYRLTELIIGWKHSHDQRQMMQVLGAWLTARGDYESALKWWRESRQLESLQQPGQTTASRSVFADILHVDEDRLLDGGCLYSEEWTKCEIQALLVLEKYAPDDKKLTWLATHLAQSLSMKGESAAALDVMCRLCGLRVLDKDETVFLVEKLHHIKIQPASFSAVFDYVKTLAKCLSALTADDSHGADRGFSSRHDLLCCKLCQAMRHLMTMFLRALNSFYRDDVSATPEQFVNFTCLLKECVTGFPQVQNKNIFHQLSFEAEAFSSIASVVKTLVVLSASVRGMNRHVNSPPHLSSDKKGDTPLHIFSRILSKKDLIQGGVLQCFLDHGAHLCTRNKQDQTVRGILEERRLLTKEELFPSLQCLAASAVVKDERLTKMVHNCIPVKARHILLDH